MKKMTKLFFIYLLLFSVGVLFAQEKKDEFKPSVTIGGTLYTGWNDNFGNNNLTTSFDTTKPDITQPFGFAPKLNQFEVSQNSFFLERAYINVLASLAPNIKGRITPDIVQITGTTTATAQYALEIKYAWIDWTAFKNDNGLALDFTLGVIPNRWIGINERYWGYRGFAKTLTDYSYVTSVSTTSANGKITGATWNTGSYFSSADLGLEAMVTGPKGFGELYLNIFSGNGYKNLGNSTRWKDFMGTLFIHPLADNLAKKMKASKTGRIQGIADVTLGGFVYMGELGKGEIGFNGVSGTTGYPLASTQYKRNRFGGMLSAKYNFKDNGFVKIGGEFSVQQNQDPGKTILTPVADSALTYTSTGLSLYLEFNPPVKELNDKLMLVARYDMFDPKTPSPNATLITNGLINFNNTTDKQSLLLLGLAYKPVKAATLGLTYQAVTYQQPFVTKRDGTTSKTTSHLIVHGILEF